jgi:DNA cross-link repair 1A protein
VHDVHVRPDLDGNERGDLRSEGSSPNIEEVPIALENPHEDWRNVLGQFPRIPSALENDAVDEPSREPTPSDGGLFLPDSALAMLQHIPLNGMVRDLIK